MNDIRCVKCGKMWYLNPYRYEFSDHDKEVICECGNDISKAGSTIDVFSEREIEPTLEYNLKYFQINGLFLQDLQDCFGVDPEIIERMCVIHDIRMKSCDIEGNDGFQPHFSPEDSLNIINRENFWDRDFEISEVDDGSRYYKELEEIEGYTITKLDSILSLCLESGEESLIFFTEKVLIEKFCSDNLIEGVEISGTSFKEVYQHSMKGITTGKKRFPIKCVGFRISKALEDLTVCR